MRTLLLTMVGALALLGGVPAAAGTLALQPTLITEWKAVYGRVEAKDTVPARARLGGIVEMMGVSEGDTVTAGQRIALVRDEKIAFQIASLDAQMRAVTSRLQTAQSDLERAQTLVQRGVGTVQKVDQLQNDVTVARNDYAALEAQRSVLVKQEEEGQVLAPLGGRVLSAPVTRGAVVLNGDTIASIGGGGFFLRLAIPERHAAMLKQGATLRIATGGAQSEGRLAKIYPLIENGRVIADVDVDQLDADFIDARILVEVPVGTREALLVPSTAVKTRSGIDFVTVESGGERVERSVIVGETLQRDEGEAIEILTGVSAGDVLVIE